MGALKPLPRRRVIVFVALALAIFLLVISLYARRQKQVGPQQIFEWIVLRYYLLHHGEYVPNQVELIDAINQLNGTDMNYYSSKGGMTLLTAACRMRNYQVVKVLISKGADVNPTQGESPLFNAVISSESSRPIAVLLLKHGADINVISKPSGDTLLHAAVRWKSKWAIPLLLNNGIDVSIRNNDGYTAYEIAVHDGDPEVLRCFSRTEAKKTIDD